MKKFVPILVVLLCAVYAGATSIPGNGTKLFWRDDFGDPNDSYVAANPGDTVFVQVEIGGPADWSPTFGRHIEAWLSSGAVVDAMTWDIEYAPYSHFADYGSGGYASDNAPDPMVIDLDFGGGNVYVFGGSAPAGGTIPTTFDYLGTYGDGGLLLGFYVPIRADAVAGSSEFLNIHVTGDGWFSWMGIVWDEELSTSVNPEWALEIAVVPEPATMGLLAIGGIAAMLRRRKK